MDRTRLRELLDRPGTERLRRALRRRLEWGGGPTVTLSRVTEAERHAVEGLLGRRARSGRSLRVPLAAVEETLQRAGIASSLADALEALDGPLVDRVAEREAGQARWAATFAVVRPQAERVGYAAWLQSLADDGLVKRLAGADPALAQDLLSGALAVLARLPVNGLSLSTLAAEVLGDAHALDRGRPTATLVRRALGERHGTGGGDPEDERALWAAAGVLLGGDLTSMVLALNLPAHAGTPTGRAVTALAEAGQPVYLTLRQLLRDRPHWQCAGGNIYVCENPTVVAEAAERLGARCAPLIATLGRPRAAALALLGQLRAAGAVLWYHGDLDWPGIAIANGIITRFDVRPWHMDSRSLKAFDRLPGRPLAGQAIAACWDDALQRTLAERGRALEEEQVVETLIADLTAPGVRHQIR